MGTRQQSETRGVRWILFGAAALACILLLGAVALALNRADALLLDLGRFVGCL